MRKEEGEEGEEEGNCIFNSKMIYLRHKILIIGNLREIMITCFEACRRSAGPTLGRGGARRVKQCLWF